MKTGVVVAAVGAAFGAGILTAVLLLQQPAPAPGGATASAGATRPEGKHPRDVALAGGAGPAAQGPAGQGAGAAPPAGAGERPPPVAPPPLPVESQPPPPPPPPPSPELLREGERAAAEDKTPGNGRVTDLVYEFESEAERQEWEAARKASWAARLQREREIKLKIMREKVGLTPGQEPRFLEILDTEAAERQRLVDALAGKQLSRTSFDEQAQACLKTAREALAKLLTPQQLEAYQQLKPREQVLLEESH